MLTYKQHGDSIDYTPSADVSAGDVVALGDMVGIAKLDIAADTLGALALSGVFEGPKVTGEIAVGTDVYWDADGDPVEGDAGSGAITATATGNEYLGPAILAAESADETVRVRLTQKGLDFPVAANQADSTADSTAGIVSDFNDLLAALEAAGLMASE